jgi:4-amino-4-deoxy-L-arabinose transferase-like glycosyltransferase
MTAVVVPEHPPYAGAAGPGVVAPAGHRRLARLVRGRVDDPAWVRPSLLGLLVATGVLYLWGLGASGWANGFYSAAVQAGSSSWKAFFFGSFDAGNAITVDKPPASLWVMSLSARAFGVNAWSILVPQALMGVATVGLVYASVRRWFTAGGGLIAGAVVALTPVAVLMFRFNNPDALLALLLTAAAYAVLRAIETASVRWMAVAGVLVGFGFLTKMLQAFIVLPAFGLVYLLAAPASFWRRVGHVTVLGLTTVMACGWWVAIVELWPAGSRPYIGGSQHNSVLELVFGYNGFGRLTGNESGSVGGGPTGTASRWGPTGWLRMFNDSFGGQISWLMPAALIVLVAGLVWTLRRSRTDRTRAALLLWGGWLVITGIVFSLGQGIIHEYYSVALAPAIGGLVGIGTAVVWEARAQWWSRVLMAATAVVTACGPSSCSTAARPGTRGCTR